MLFFFFKQKTAYEMRISDWSSDVCSSDLTPFDAMDCPVLQLVFTGGDIGSWRAGTRGLSARGRRRGNLRRGRADAHRAAAGADQIGREACRERVWPYV